MALLTKALSEHRTFLTRKNKPQLEEKQNNRIPPKQLKLHINETDAWIAIEGFVYDATGFIQHHPGGINSFLEGVGKDATDLFMTVHPWVDYHKIMKPHLVGALPHWAVERSRLGGFKISPSLSFLDNRSRMPEIMHEWKQHVKTISLLFFTGIYKMPELQIVRTSSKKFEMKIYRGNNLSIFHVFLEHETNWPLQLGVDYESGRVDLILTKLKPRIWTNMGRIMPVFMKDVLRFQVFNTFKLVFKRRVNYKCMLLVFKRLDGCIINSTPGSCCHIKKDNDCIRPYSSVPLSLQNDTLTEDTCATDRICFVIKRYPDGEMSTFMTGLEIGSLICIDHPRSILDVESLADKKHFVMIACGVAITSMFSVIIYLLKNYLNTTEHLCLLHFARYKEDILFSEMFRQLAVKESKFSVQYCLTQPGPFWKGNRGRISKTILLDTLEPILTNKYYMETCWFISGPLEFVDTASCILEELNVHENCVHTFSQL